MADESWRQRVDEDAWTRLTGLALLVEAGVCGILAVLPFILGELSDLELQASVSAILIGGTLGWPILFAPRAMSVSSIGRLSFVLIAAVQIALLAVIAIQLFDYADPGLGMSVSAVAFDLLSATYVLVVLTGCARVLVSSSLDAPSARRRRFVSRVGLLIALGCLVLGTTLAAADGNRIRCATFDFDSSRWKADGPTETRSVSERERIAESLVRCDTLIGKTKGEVGSMLGSGWGKGKRRLYSVGWVNDAIGLGDGQELIVNYGPGDRVLRAHLLYPSD